MSIRNNPLEQETSRDIEGVTHGTQALVNSRGDLYPGKTIWRKISHIKRTYDRLKNVKLSSSSHFEVLQANALLKTHIKQVLEGSSLKKCDTKNGLA